MVGGELRTIATQSAHNGYRATSITQFAGVSILVRVGFAVDRNVLPKVVIKKQVTTEGYRHLLMPHVEGRNRLNDVAACAAECVRYQAGHRRVVPWASAAEV